MTNPFRKGECGMSIVGGLVTIAVLGTILVSVDTAISPSNSESLVAAAKLAAVDPGASVDTAPAKAIVTPVGVAAPDASSEIADNPKPRVVNCNVSGKTIPRTIYYACFQKGQVGKIKELTQQCSPGFKYTVTESKGNISVTPTPLAGDPLPAGCTVPPPPTCKTDGKQAVQSTSNAGCKVVYCVAGKCTSVHAEVGKPVLDDSKRLESIQNLLKSPENTSAVMNELALSSAEAGALNAVLGQETSNLTQEIDLQGEVVDKASTDYEDALKKIGEECGGDLVCMNNNKALADSFAKFEEEQKRLEELQAQKESLAAAQKSLVGGKPPGDGETGCPSSGCPCPSGTYGTPGNCVRINTDTFSSKQLPPGYCIVSTNPIVLKPCSGGGGSGGGLGGLLQALGGGQPPAGNQTPQQPGSCSGGQAVCSNNTIYSRNNQCVDTVVKYCEHGCSGNACAQEPAACPSAPAQPDAVNCPNGTWKPTNTGACVSGWQCSNSQGDGPAAQISCQPDVADVGMEIAITYSCSAGTSVGAGFSTEGAQSGATSTTITSLPANTNTATYTLTCTDAGRSSNTSCTVQVGKPSIVLVANPANVRVGTASSLGWVTAGMKSCVITSPDLDDFTNQNAHLKNVSGTATTPQLTSTTDFVLRCITLGGSTREAETTIRVTN